MKRRPVRVYVSDEQSQYRERWNVDQVHGVRRVPYALEDVREEVADRVLELDESEHDDCDGDAERNAFPTVGITALTNDDRIDGRGEREETDDKRRDGRRQREAHEREPNRSLFR